MTAAVRVDGVYKTFGDNLVLRGIDVEVQPHEVVALIGASGSGKSTLLRCVNLLEQVDDGQIWLGDQDITAVDVKPDLVRRRIGMVFQSFNLFPHMTAIQNVTLAARKVHKMKRRDANEKAAALLAQFGLEGKEKAYPDRLSGGQQQRVAFARTLMTDPDVVLLDEVTSALDPELVGEVLEIIRELRERGMTMMMATHEMQFCREIADQVCFLDSGRILEQGTPDEVFGSPREPRTREFLRRVLSH
jgi:polar amino acid transport system ATP-binding protein